MLGDGCGRRVACRVGVVASRTAVRSSSRSMAPLSSSSNTENRLRASSVDSEPHEVTTAICSADDALDIPRGIVSAVDKEASAKCISDCAVLACGPDALLAGVKQAIADVGTETSFQFHEETFDF